ncbi:hypothetical protein NITHO_500031 [Nitrolancea hollandica Lb]|uniref:Uncharacterized protein n=2 Tax=Nitrolancea hollandica TaxID=1206749 RepID=I4ELD4_9BACT|nr:hypothetical protein NITHO_500031 [Nitrolancea hollandica Lb]
MNSRASLPRSADCQFLARPLAHALLPPPLLLGIQANGSIGVTHPDPNNLITVRAGLTDENRFEHAR